MRLPIKQINFERKTESIHKRSHKAIKIVFAAVVVALVLEVWMVNRLSTYGNQMAEIKQQEGALSLRNQILENQIAKAGALFDVEHKSEQLGFSPVSSYSYFKAPAIASAQ